MIQEKIGADATAGLYDSSGFWMYSVGLQAKSGVGGTMVAVYPGKFAVAAFTSPLDSFGKDSG